MLVTYSKLELATIDGIYEEKNINHVGKNIAPVLVAVFLALIIQI
jgi:hypothetical protein